jgi:hypothetical protein
MTQVVEGLLAAMWGPEFNPYSAINTGEDVEEWELSYTICGTIS